MGSDAITAWRAGLSDRERGRLTTAQSNVKRWRKSNNNRGQHNQCPGDLKAKATAHWRRFVQTMRLLPPTEAESLWRQSLFEMVGPSVAQAEFNVATTGINEK